MSDRRNDPKLNSPDLRKPKGTRPKDVRDPYSLEEILSEYEVPPGGAGLILTSRPKPDPEDHPSGQKPPEEAKEAGKRGAREAPPDPDAQSVSPPRGRREAPASPPSAPSAAPSSAAPAAPPEGTGRRKRPEAPAAGRSSAPDGKVLSFPGSSGRASPEHTQPPRERSRTEPPPPPVREEPPKRNPPGSDTVVPFPKHKGPVASFLRNLTHKSDRYAAQMYQDDERTSAEEVQRLETLIPGTDQEDPIPIREEPPEPLGQTEPVRKRPRFSLSQEDPVPPDVAPSTLAKAFGRGQNSLRTRRNLLLLLFFLSLLPLIPPAAGMMLPAPLDSPRFQAGYSAVLLTAGILLSLNVLLMGIARAADLRFGMDLLAVFGCFFTLLDAIVLTVRPGEVPRVPYAAVLLACLCANLHGTGLKRSAQRLSCKAASASSAPYRITLDREKWNGKDTFCKWTGDSKGFGSQIQMDDGAQHLFRLVCPFLLILCLLLPPILTWGHWNDLLWAWSALFAASSALGSALCYGRSFYGVAQRLMSSGGALAGWPGIRGSRRGSRILVTDSDLFPPGTISLNGYRVMGDFPQERVLAYTATILRDSGSPMTRMFHDQLRAIGGLMRNTASLTPHEGGGFSAYIRGDRVLVGSAAFMNLMDVEMPPGLSVKSALYCAINGDLAGIFALNYTLPDSVPPSLEALLHEKVGPVLATRDPNLIPAMLQQRFRLAADRMEFPPVERRRQLSDENQKHDSVLTALVCREGLCPLAEAVTAARRMRRATLLGAALCCLGSALGILLSAYLVSVSAYGSLSALNLLLYMLAWLLPVWLLSDWVHRF